MIRKFLAPVPFGSFFACLISAVTTVVSIRQRPAAVEAHRVGARIGFGH